MFYTVKEVSELSKVTVKALHHYHKIGLLVPSKISEAGYRLYGMKELERLQQILFYKELDIPLEKIKQLLAGEPERLMILADQKELLLARRKRLEDLIETLEESIKHTERGESMEHTRMFNGFSSEEEWQEALQEQKRYLKEQYDYELPTEQIDPQELNEQAREAKRFMEAMASLLREGCAADGERVQHLMAEHIAFLGKSGHATGASEFAKQARFFVADDFHRKMLEDQQTGLAYYLCVAAESFASKEEAGE